MYIFFVVQRTDEIFAENRLNWAKSILIGVFIMKIILTKLSVILLLTKTSIVYSYIILSDSYLHINIRNVLLLRTLHPSLQSVLQPQHSKGQACGISYCRVWTIRHTSLYARARKAHVSQIIVRTEKPIPYHLRLVHRFTANQLAYIYIYIIYNIHAPCIYYTFS